METLSYFLSKREPILIFSFKGNICQGCERIFVECQKEAQALEDAITILNLADVKSMDPRSVRSFTIFKKALRESCHKLLICALSAELEKFLIENGILDHGEAKAELVDALREASLMLQQFKAAN